MGSEVLRTALLSAVERSEDGTPRAFLELGGRTILVWQADLAISLGCERIVCLAQGPTPELLELQQELEEKGLSFQLIRGSLQLVSLLSADQDILVMADGLVFDRELAHAAIGDKRGIAALPAEEGIAAGFERIDANRAWAGLLVARANIVERLADMPPDVDTISLILRLALQAGVPVVLCDKQHLDSGNVLIGNGQDALKVREKSLLDVSSETAPWSAPGIAVSHRLARRLAPDGLARGPLVAAGISLASGAASIALAAADYVPAAVAIFAAAAFSAETGIALTRLRARLFSRQDPNRVPKISLLLDIVMAIVLTLPATLPMVPERAFLPVLLLGLLRLANRQLPSGFKELAADRTLLAILLAASAWFGVLPQAMAILSLAVLGSLLFRPGSLQITRD